MGVRLIVWPMVWLPNAATMALLNCGSGPITIQNCIGETSSWPCGFQPPMAHRGNDV